MKILLVEDEPMTRTVLADVLRKENHAVTPCPDGHVALTALQQDCFDLVLTDLNLPGPDGLEILSRARADGSQTKVIIMTAYASTETAIEALRSGADDYITKPFQPEEVLAHVRRVEELLAVVEENRTLREQLEAGRRRRIVGDSPAMKQLIKTIEAVAPGDFNVLIQGPSGTGKELVARALHDASSRADRPFVAVNCSAIPETLVESELFGYRRGAFTGAERDHVGYFARAEGGSLFVDDIDDLPMTVQVKLLRVIQEREIEPVGGGQSVPVDFRLITATKEDLKSLADQGRFREDLYYRLNVIPLKLPTLAERKEDIPALVRHFVARRGGPADFTLSPERYAALLDYHWPGNVRELQNVVERMLALPAAAVRELFDEPSSAAAGLWMDGEDGTGPDNALPSFGEYMRRCEDRILRTALNRADGNISVAARLLGLPRSTLRSKLEKD